MIRGIIYILAVVGLIVLLSGEGRGQTFEGFKQQCITKQNASSIVLSRIPGATIRPILDRETIDEIVKIYNKVPPVSNIKVDNILIVNSRFVRPGISFILFFNNGCVIEYTSILTVILEYIEKNGTET